MTEVEFSSHFEVESSLEEGCSLRYIYIYIYRYTHTHNGPPFLKHQIVHHGGHPTQSWLFSIFNQLGVGLTYMGVVYLLALGNHPHAGSSSPATVASSSWFIWLYEPTISSTSNFSSCTDS